MKAIKVFLLLGISGFVLGAGIVYSGIYPIGADVPHNSLTYWLLETARERSIKRAASDIDVPDLTDPILLLKGGADYNDMCAACHLKPGKTQSDLSIGLYPSPPNLAVSVDNHGHDHGSHGDEQYGQQRQFWIIKHGIKASGMPAWGPTHDDERIWAMVAFLQELPSMSPEQYQILSSRSDANVSDHH